MTALPPDLAEAVASRAFVAWDGEFWAVGRYGSAAITTKFRKDDSMAFAAWGNVVIVRSEGDSTIFSLVDPITGDAKDVSRVPGELDNLNATTDPPGDTIYFHDSIDGLDRGLRSIDVATGAITTLTKSSPLTDDEVRLQLVWSPSGSLLVSSLCNQRTCKVDVLDVGLGSVRRLDERFAVLAASDRFLLGRDQKPEDPLGEVAPEYAVMDLETQDVRFLPRELILQPSTVVPVSGDRFLVDTVQVGLGRYEIVSVDAAGDDHRVLYTTADPTLTGIEGDPVSGAMLLAPGGGGTTMIEVIDGTPLSVITSDGQLYEDAIPAIR